MTKLRRGFNERLLTLRLRLRGKALASGPPAWRPTAFKEALHLALQPQRGLSLRWPAGTPKALAELEVISQPDEALFGSRVETSSGPYAAKVLHAAKQASSPGRWAMTSLPKAF